jgi:hypothetical protein
MTADSVAPSTQQYLTHPVPCGPNDLWVPIPQEVEDVARDKLEEEAAGKRVPCGPNDLWVPIPQEAEDVARDKLEEEASGKRGALS